MKYTVLKARLTWDRFKVEAETPEEADLVFNEEIREDAQDVSWLHDAIYDSDGDVTVLDTDANDPYGFSRVLFRRSG